MKHSGHDFERLSSAWQALVRAKGWEQTVIGEAQGHPVFAIQNRRSAAGEDGGIYVSAGVHGDECAPPWALLQWAESSPSLLEELPFLFVPCFNPVGLIENTRHDGDKVDLNRNFQNRELPLIAAWQDLLEGRRFSMALNLHEDYDATGIYLYEISDGGSPGDSFLSACQDLIPRETAASVDGSDFENGLLSHDADEADLRSIVEEDLGGGMPEAIYLYLNHSGNSFTFETPSEMELRQRIRTHHRFLGAVSEYLLTGKNRSLGQTT